MALRLLNGCGEVVKFCRCAVALHDGFKHGAGVAQVAQLLDQSRLNWLQKHPFSLRNGDQSAIAQSQSQRLCHRLV